MSALRVGLVQLEVEDGRPRRNLERAIDRIRGAEPADLYLLPELWTTGYAHDTWRRCAAADTPGIVAELRRLSGEIGAYIGGSTIALDGDERLVNRFWLFDPEGGEPIAYDKGHLFPPMLEDRHLAAGRRRVRARLGDWTAALSICFDLRFPEMYRLDAVDGAELFLVVAEWPAERAGALELFARARAAENQAYLALCNRVGAGADGTRFHGGSMLVAPDGSVAARAGDDEAVVVGRIDLDAVRAAREALPVLPARREHLDW